jgi:hypothetical protein
MAKNVGIAAKHMVRPMGKIASEAFERSPADGGLFFL